MYHSEQGADRAQAIVRARRSNPVKRGVTALTNSYCRMLFQINTRVRLNEIAAQLGRPATLDDISDAELDDIASLGLRLGLAARRVANRPRGAPDLACAMPVCGASSRRRCPT